MINWKLNSEMRRLWILKSDRDFMNKRRWLRKRYSLAILMESGFFNPLRTIWTFPFSKLTISLMWFLILFLNEVIAVFTLHLFWLRLFHPKKRLIMRSSSTPSLMYRKVLDLDLSMALLTFPKRKSRCYRFVLFAPNHM